MVNRWLKTGAATSETTAGRAVAARPIQREGGKQVTPEFIIKFQEMAIAAIAAFLLLLVEHILPWQRLFGQKPQPPWSYVAGVIALSVPFCTLLVHWGEWWTVGAWLAVVICGGLPVIVGYDVRMRLEFKSLRNELNRALRLADDLVASIRGRGK